MKSETSRRLAGEFIGTFLLVFFGCGSVASAVLTGAPVGIGQVALVWGIGIALAIYLTAGLSGAHLNPAVTGALVVAGRFPLSRVPLYLAGQFAGAITAAAVLHAIFTGPLLAFEAAQGIVRGLPGSEASGMIFGEYFPNPGGRPLAEATTFAITPGAAFLVEAVGTLVLALVILGVTDERNTVRPRELAPWAIGFTVAALISLLAPLTQAGFNPARDLGPRLWSALAGWGSVPFTANGWGWLTVYVLGPVAGGIGAAVLYRGLLRPGYTGGESA